MNIPISIGKKDYVFRAWYDAIPELAVPSRSTLLKALMRAVINKKTFCVGRIHQYRIDEAKKWSGHDRKYFNVTINDDIDSDIKDWLLSLKESSYSVSMIIKTYVVRSLQVIPDSEPEYMPDYQECIMSENLAPTVIAASVPSIPAQPVPKATHTIARSTDNLPEKDYVSDNRVVDKEKEPAMDKSPSEPHTDIFIQEEEDKPQKRKNSKFAALGGATRH